MASVDLIVHNGFVVTGKRASDEIPDGAIAINQGKIIDIADTTEIFGRYSASDKVDASGHVVFPGFVNTHTHLFQILMKGLGEGIHVHSWINSVTIPGLRKMSENDFYVSARAACLDAIRSGTTTLLEFMYPNNRHDAGDAIFEGILDSGIRGVLGRGVADIEATEGDIVRNAYYAEFLEPVEELFDDCIRLYKKCEEKGKGKIRFCLAPPYFRCLSPAMLDRIRDFIAKFDCFVSMHLYETARDNEVALERHGMSTAQWLEQNGLLSPKLLAVHCVNIDDDAIKRFVTHHVKVSYNPVSNMYLGNGISPIAKFLNEGATVGFATDGAASNNSQNMIETLKTGVLLQRVANRDPQIMCGRDAFYIATMGGAEALGMNDQIGSLEVGKRADIVLANFSELTSSPCFNPINTLVYSADSRCIKTVIIDGTVILRNGEFVSVDEELVIRETQAAGLALAKKAYNVDILKHASYLRD